MIKDIKKVIHNFSFVYVLFFLSSILLLIVAVIFSFLVKDIEKERIDSIQNHLLVAAQRASVYLTVEELDLFHTAEDMERPEWEDIRTRLKRFAEESAVLYVYYWRYDGGDHIQYIIDNDEDEEYMVTPDLFFALEDDPFTADAVLKIENGESWVTELGVYTDSWDGLLSAVVPMFSHDGTVYCAAGVDISDEVLITMRNNVRRMELVLLFSLSISILSGFFGIRSYNKKASQSASDSLSKSRFLSNMSHEIRTPMNAILGIAEIQLQDNTLREELSQAFRQIYDSGELLLNITNDILDLSKIEAGKLELSPKEYELPSLINDTTQLNRLWFKSKPLDFIVTVDKDTPYKLFGDGLRIKQILSNLLSNAYKYTEEGEIRLTVAVEPEENSDTVTLIMQVSDTGQGMTPSQLNNLFDAYSRFNIEENRDIAGAGLGMNITRHLVNMMNGEINVESEAGTGTVVTVRLPQRSCGAGVCGSGIVEELRTFSFRNKSITKMAKIAHEQMPNGRILIVDDVNTNLQVAQGLMRPYGLSIDTVNSGFEAIEKISNKEEYDIIFMDHMMPIMDGIEATKIIRETGYTNPIVALTANAIVGKAEMFLTNGFDAFIAKPIDSFELDQVLKSLIKDKNPGGHIEVIKTPVDSSKMKKMFVLDAKNALTVLNRILSTLSETDDGDLELYTVTVHGIKSALDGIGEKSLSGFAYRLEQAGKDRNADYIVSMTPAFITELINLAEKYEQTDTAECDEISQEDILYLREKINIINEACESFNINIAKSTLVDLKQKVWPRPITLLYDEISTGLLRGEFDEVMYAIGKIESIIQNHQPDIPAP